jgi:hypothetical protein
MPKTIDFLQNLGDAATFFVVTATLVVCALLLPWLRQRLGLSVRKEVMDGASDAFKAVVSSLIFVLAFALYQVQANFRDAEQLVNKEANQLNTMDRLLLRYGSPEASAARSLVEQYANTEIRVEWPLLQHDGRSDEVDTLYEKLASLVRALEPSSPRQMGQFNDMQRSLDEMADVREARLAMTQTSLPSLYWAMITGLLVLLAILVTITHATQDKQLSHAGLACAVGLLLSLVVIIDGPFKGQTSVGPTAISRVLKVIQARQF